MIFLKDSDTPCLASLKTACSLQNNAYVLSLTPEYRWFDYNSTENICNEEWTAIVFSVQARLCLNIPEGRVWMRRHSGANWLHGGASIPGSCYFLNVIYQWFLLWYRKNAKGKNNLICLRRYPRKFNIALNSYEVLNSVSQIPEDGATSVLVFRLYFFEVEEQG